MNQNASSEQRLIERLHSLDVSVRQMETRLGVMEESLREVRQDVKSLMSFRAFLWGGAAAVSGVTSLLMTLLTLWWRH